MDIEVVCINTNIRIYMNYQYIYNNLINNALTMGRAKKQMTG